MALALALGLILTFAERWRMVELPVLMCLLVLTIYPLRIRVLDIEGENPNLLANARFYAVLAFEDILTELESSRTFVARSVFPHLFINDDPNELRALFNVALDARTEQDNFEIGAMNAEFIEDLELGEFNHVLISSDDWEWMRTAPQDRPEWRDHSFKFRRAIRTIRAASEIRAKPKSIAGIYRLMPRRSEYGVIEIALADASRLVDWKQAGVVGAGYGLKGFDYPWIATSRDWNSDEAVLDVGAGYSPLPAHLAAEHGCELWAVDDFGLSNGEPFWQRGQDPARIHQIQSRN